MNWSPLGVVVASFIGTGDDSAIRPSLDDMVAFHRARGAVCRPAVVYDCGVPAPYTVWNEASPTPPVVVRYPAAAPVTEAPASVSTDVASLSAPELLARARRALNAKDVLKAADLYEQLVKVDPAAAKAEGDRVPMSIWWRASRRFAAGQLVPAIDDYDQASRLLPAGHERQALLVRHRGTARVLYGMRGAPADDSVKLFDAAIADLESTVAADPKDAQAHYWLAYSYAVGLPPARRNGERAVDHARKSCELTDYKNWEYVMVLATANAQIGKFEDGLKQLDDAYAMVPDVKRDKVRQLRDHFERRLPLP